MPRSNRREWKLEDLPKEVQEMINALEAGEELFIVRERRPIAKLLPLPQEPARPTFGSARGLVTMTDDFDAPLEDFRDYL